MFCPKCGSTLKDGAAFCNKCGYKIGSGTQSADKQPKKVEQSIKITNTTKVTADEKKKPSIIMLTIIGAVVLIAVLVIAALVLGNVTKKKSEKEGKVTEVATVATYENEEDYVEDYEEDETEERIEETNTVKETTKAYETTVAAYVETTTIQQITYAESTTVATEASNEVTFIEDANVPTANPDESNEIEETTEEVSASEYCTITSYEARTESVGDDIPLLISVPTVSCSDEELESVVNNAIDGKIDRIIDYYNNIVNMESGEVVSISFSNAKIDDGKRKVVVSWKGTMIFADGDSKDVAVSITYNKETDQSSISCQ